MLQRFQRWILGLVTVVTYLGAADTQAEAQVRFGIRIGGVRVGVGNRPIYGPGYGRGYYGPGYGIGYGTRYGYGYRPAPVYVPQPIYVQPQPIYVPSQPQYAAPTAIPAGAPLADGGEIVLFSPTTNTANIRYSLNGQTFTMPPGTKQRFTNDRSWTIQFESAPGQMVTYTLTSNRYKFKSGGTGVGLFQTQDLPEVVQPGLPPAPIPNPPEARR